MFGGIELKPEDILQFVLEALGIPPFPQKEKFQSRPFAVFAQRSGTTEEFGNAANRVNHLVPANKRIETNRKVWVSRKPSAHAQGEAGLGLAAEFPSSRRQANIIDLRIRTPVAAARQRNFELARQIVAL